MNRRNFFSMLAGLPFVGSVISKVEPERHNEYRRSSLDDFRHRMLVRSERTGEPTWFNSLYCMSYMETDPLWETVAGTAPASKERFAYIGRPRAHYSSTDTAIAM